MPKERPIPSISTGPEPGSGLTAGDSDRRRPSARASGAPRSVALNVVLAILVAGLMIAGWFVANQHQLLIVEQEARADAERRLVVLEDRLRLTDETLTETGTDTSKQINRWESEIRKLWAVSNERNKNWIQENKTTLEKQSKLLDQASKNQTELKQELAKLSTALTALNGVKDSIAAVDKKAADVAKTQAQLVTRVNQARQAVASLQGGLVNRVEDTEQAVKSIDAFRVQLNRRLSDIEQQLQGPPG